MYLTENVTWRLVERRIRANKSNLGGKLMKTILKTVYTCVYMHCKQIKFV